MHKTLDWQIILTTGVIILFGLLIHFSVSPNLVNYHFLYILLGLVAAVVAYKLDYSFFVALNKHLYVAAVLMLAITYVLGSASHGSTRWLEIAGFQFQPSETAKIMLIFAFSGILKNWDFSKFFNLIKILVLALIPAGLIFIQPDLGTATILMLITLSMIFAAGARLKHILILVLLLTLVSPLMWHSLKSYQKDRIHTFIDPKSDPLGRGYNSIQAIIAVGSGQIFGRGLGHGTQSKLKFLPEYQTDFVFASLAEELGLLGCLVLITMYTWLLIRLFFITSQVKDIPAYLILIGIIFLIGSQVVINIGMNLGLFPVTGITLPLVSSGGTSIITTLTAIGIATNLASRRESAFAIEIS